MELHQVSRHKNLDLDNEYVKLDAVSDQEIIRISVENMGAGISIKDKEMN
jgi:hypothetical protein